RQRQPVAAQREQEHYIQVSGKQLLACCYSRLSPKLPVGRLVVLACGAALDSSCAFCLARAISLVWLDCAFSAIRACFCRSVSALALSRCLRAMPSHASSIAKAAPIAA